MAIYRIKKDKRMKILESSWCRDFYGVDEEQEMSCRKTNKIIIQKYEWKCRNTKYKIQKYKKEEILKDNKMVQTFLWSGWRARNEWQGSWSSLWCKSTDNAWNDHDDNALDHDGDDDDDDA